MEDEKKAEENGQIDVEKLDLAKFGVQPADMEVAKERLLSFVKSNYEMERERHVAAPGTFNLPPLLEERRLKWKIPDGAFRVAAGTVYDRILIWQIPLLSECTEDEHFIGGAGGTLYKSDQTREKDTREAPRGVIIGAGLRALDALRSNGIDLGHIVYFCKNTVYSIQVDYIAGKWERVSLAREGDLVLSEDVSLAMRTGAMKVVPYEIVGKDGSVRTEHLLADGNGIARERMLPPAEDDL
jgi:hypothetical protein